MKISFLKRGLVILFLLYLPFQSLAWGLLGHRIVGEIAESYLTPKAKKEVYKILGNESIAMASNWADFIKSNPAFGYLYNWHFVDFEKGLTQQQMMDYLDKDTATDAYTKINFLANELKKGKLSPQDKSMYLRLLIHIVGDVHQPLHVGRPEDKGGNKIRLIWFKDSSNLHQVWDEKLINFQQLSYTEYTKAINHATVGQIMEWKKEPVSKWIYQSYQYAERIYSEMNAPYQKLDYKYNYDYLDILNQQLLKAGVHLAALLNTIFDH